MRDGQTWWERFYATVYATAFATITYRLLRISIRGGKAVEEVQSRESVSAPFHVENVALIFLPTGTRRQHVMKAKSGKDPVATLTCLQVPWHIAGLIDSTTSVRLNLNHDVLG
jgi:hypothetical protein